MSRFIHPHNLLAGALVTFVLTLAWQLPSSDRVSAAAPQEGAGKTQPSLNSQSQEEVNKKSAGCLTCHTPDAASMHASKSVRAGCTDCHGGNAGAMRDKSVARGTPAFDDLQRLAHDVEPRLSIWNGSAANPANVWAQTLEESERFIRFQNPGDLRVAHLSCGSVGCHREEVWTVGKSMMRHGGMLWGAALYNNGSFPYKDTRFGEFYLPNGAPATAFTTPPPTPTTTQRTGILPFLSPLFPWQVSQPGNVLRIFERGGRRPLEIGVPDPEEEPGRPKNRLSNRGLGTLNRTDPVFIGLQKTRLLDPTLNFMGSNDVAGDYRGSGCTACHVIYANDRSRVHSLNYAAAGNQGRSQTTDEMISKEESGHPIRHVLTRAIPTSQCMTCHMHPGTNMVATYQGLTWWDNETDGDKMYPPTPRPVSARARVEIEKRNPEGSAVRGLWSDPEFLSRTGSPEFNAQLKQTQFADFHGHGWLFRAVFKRDRKGNLIDANGTAVTDSSAAALGEAVNFTDLRPFDKRPPTLQARNTERAGKPVHLKDIHLERGMQCVDCHFKRDNHGNGNLYGEPRNAVEITCADCHGTARRPAYNDPARPAMSTTGPAAPEGGGTDLMALSTPFGDQRFEFDGDRLLQRSMTVENLEWAIPQIFDSATADGNVQNPKARLAHTIQRDGKSWGVGTSPNLAHADERMSCTTCHSSWITSCFGCHLSQTANQKRQALHNEINTTRNWTSYNFQVLRDDVYMLGKDGSVIGGKISPVRSSSAVVVSSQDLNRQWIYYQQQTVSAEGYSGQAFNTHVPHTVRTTETKMCTDCHVSSNGDNNAWMSQLLLLGTNFVNFMGRFVYVATGHDGVQAVAVTEMDEPQAVIGSDLHRLAYPREYAAHLAGGRELKTSVHHGSSNAMSVQARGEYVYIADGEGGFKVFDIAQVNQKGFSEKIVSAPVSPLGQNTNVGTRYATAVAAPSTLAVDPARTRLPENEEQPIHPMYAYIYVTDREEGLVITTAATLLDGNPSNNFLRRAAAFNPEGRLRGAKNLALAGHYAYVLCDRGLVIVNLDDPLKPTIAAEIAAPAIKGGTAVAIQFRYAFITDAEGLKVVDITVPESPRLVTGATVKLADARSVYVARTYAYIAAGKQGLVIVDVERPEQPRVDQTFTADGALNDVNDVKIAMTNASAFAYVADGHNGLRVLQIVSANRTPGAFGFSPRPAPELIATYHTHGPALAISKGLDRDRAVDETGHQLAVFGRRGGRPFNFEEMRRMYLRDGKVWTVSDAPPGPPVDRASVRLWPSHVRGR